MHTTVQLPTVSTNTDTLSHTIVRNPARLLALRVSWVLLLVAILLIGILGVSAMYDALTKPAAESIVRDFIYPVESEIFASYIAATIIISIVFSTFYAGFIYYRVSNSWFMWMATIVMPLFAITGNSLQIIVSFYYPQLQWLAWLLAYGAMLSLGSLSWIYPDGRFVPSWLYWLVPVELMWWLISIPIYVDTGIAEETFIAIRDLLYMRALISGLVAIAVQTYRFRRSSVVQRQQLKWVFLGAVTVITLYLIAVLGYVYLVPTLHNPQLQFIAQVVLFPLPNYASIIGIILLGFAITRNRLWDIDLIINKSLVYGLFVTLVIGIFFAVVVGLQIIFGQTQPFMAFVVASILMITVFRPVTHRIQNWVDRYIYRLNFNLNELAAAQKLPEILKPGMLSGKNLGGYEVCDVLGQGGMGEVYQGSGNSQTVAIKTMLPKIAQDRDMRKRFEREAEAGMQLDHPNIAKVYSHGETDGTPYLVMDYIEGQDLSQTLKTGGKLDEETTSRMMTDICSALDIAHSQGFIHRDLKPANIMIKANGEAVLMDFGVTKMADATSSLTGTGAIGTIDYMAPEQIMSSREVDHRVDIYALGVMLYELLTGEKPFNGSPAQVMFAHLQQPPPDPRDANEDIPRPIAKAIMQAMAKKPEERFQSAGEFAAALQVPQQV
jgi:tRNA A-37 threonylcarbamoyl transferase component Bud32